MLALLFVALRLQHAMEAVATETQVGAAPLFRPDRCGSDLRLFPHGIDNFVDRQGKAVAFAGMRTYRHSCGRLCIRHRRRGILPLHGLF